MATLSPAGVAMGPLNMATMARALDGDPEALETCAHSDVDGAVARRHRLAAALARRAVDSGIAGPAVASWRKRLRQVAAHHMLLDFALEGVGQVLAKADIRWAPIKGVDLAHRVYASPEDRPTSDLDILIDRRSFNSAREALSAAGWQPLSSGAEVDRYQQEEGYAWQARGPRGALLELHFRLWGSVAADMGDAIIAAAREPAPGTSLPPGGTYVDLAHAYVLAAVHLWLDAPPRRLGAFWDLASLSDAAGVLERSNMAAAVVEAADRFDVQLPVLMAARLSAGWWQRPACGEIAAALALSLRAPERRWLAGRRDLESTSLLSLTLIRHAARRRMRHGLLRSAWRRVWAHPGIVEAAQGSRYDSRLARRLDFQARAWGLRRHRPFPGDLP